MVDAIEQAVGTKNFTVLFDSYLVLGLQSLVNDMSYATKRPLVTSTYQCLGILGMIGCRGQLDADSELINIVVDSLPYG